MLASFTSELVLCAYVLVNVVVYVYVCAGMLGRYTQWWDLCAVRCLPYSCDDGRMMLPVYLPLLAAHF